MSGVRTVRCWRQLSMVLRPSCLERLLGSQCTALSRHASNLTRHKTTPSPKSDPQSDNPEPVLEVYASMRQVKTSPMKLNLVAKLIRGMSITDALAQMKFCEKKPSKFVESTLLDAQRRAEQSFEIDPWNLHVAESYVGKGTYLKRIRYHGKGMSGQMYKYYSHYFLKLKAGPPPPKKKRKKEDHKSFLTRKWINAGPRTIPNSL